MRTSSRVGRYEKTLSALAAFGVGVAQYVLLSLSWGVLGPVIVRSIVSIDPDHGWFRTLTYASDVIVNVLLSIPAAYVLCRLRPKRLPLYTVIAVAPSFAWTNQLIFSDPRPFADWGMLRGLVLQAFSLPIAVLLVQRLAAEWRTHDVPA